MFPSLFSDRGMLKIMEEEYSGPPLKVITNYFYFYFIYLEFFFFLVLKLSMGFNFAGSSGVACRFGNVHVGRVGFSWQIPFNTPRF